MQATFVKIPVAIVYFRPMVLITGGTGLVGSHLLYALLKRGETVRATKRNSSNLADVELSFSFYGDDAKNLLSTVEWVDVDLLNPAEVDELFIDVDRVFHCAATVSFKPSDKQRMIEENPAMTANLVNAALAHNVLHFAYTSSIAALGRNKGPNDFTNEETEWKSGPQNSNYSISKYLSELEVWRGIEEGLCAAMVNPTIILGAANWNQSSSAIFKRYASGFKYYTTGKNGFVDVRDVVDALIKLSDERINQERFILVGENLAYRDMANKMATAFGQKPPSRQAKEWLSNLLWRIEKWRSILFNIAPLITKETARSARSTWQYNNKKAREKLGMNFRPIDQSIVEFAAFYKRELK